MESKSLLRLKAIFQPLADLIFAPSCFACGAGIFDAKALLCEDCQAKISLPTPDICDLCGTQLQQSSCPYCAESQSSFDLARSSFLFQSPLRELIHRLKYQSWDCVSSWLAPCMAKTFHCEPGFEACNIITCVPLHRVRQRERGFNQSELIARRLARLLGLKYQNLAKRRRYTLSQTHLSKQAREHNLDGAFVSCQKSLSGMNILLIDDVFTTGTTVNKLSTMFKNQGANKVCVLTAARAI